MILCFIEETKYLAWYDGMQHTIVGGMWSLWQQIQWLRLLPSQSSREQIASEVRSRDGLVALEACSFTAHYFQLGPTSLDGLQLPSQYHKLETKVSRQ